MQEPQTIEGVVMLKSYTYELKLITMLEDWSDKTDPGVLKPTVTVVDSVEIPLKDLEKYKVK